MIGRRSLLMTAAAFGGWRTLGTPGLALADAPTENRMILVILRGGLDGLAAVPPFGDAQYRQVRGSLSLPAPGDTDGVIDLDGFFALHPALSPIHELYRRDELLVIHAAASPYRERSHFDGQDVLENGGARVGIQRGRLAQSCSRIDSDRRTAPRARGRSRRSLGAARRSSGGVVGAVAARRSIAALSRQGCRSLWQ